ncbi:MAG: O-antigen ligase family protein [Candidatus Omnitrophota bacterium]|nr:O-antigen ligase family protein [Candidatus Omnitrophota bacterium]
MLIKKLDYITEFFLWVLAVGITVNNAPTEVATGILIFIFLVKRFILKKIPLPNSPINIFLYLLFIIVLISALRSSYFKESIRGFSRIPKYIFLYFALLDFFCADKKRLVRFFWVLLTVSTVTFLNGIFQSIFGFDLFKHNMIDEPDSLRRISSSFVHPNDFGAYIISVLPLTFLVFSSVFTKRKRLLIGLVFLLGAYCLMKTSSRGAWVGFLFGAMLYFFMYNKKIAIVIPVVILLLIAFSPHGFERLSSLFRTEQNTVWERTQLWQGTWAIIKEHPVLGFGVNTFSKYFPQYKPVDYPDLRYAHNSYLQMWSEIGIVGLFTFLAIPVIVLRKTFGGIKNKITMGFSGLLLLGLISGYIGFLIHSAFDNNLFSLVLTTLFWVFTAYIVSLNKCLK